MIDLLECIQAENYELFEYIIDNCDYQICHTLIVHYECSVPEYRHYERETLKEYMSRLPAHLQMRIKKKITDDLFMYKSR